MTHTLDRSVLMAFRILASGLDRSGPADAVLRVGVQDRDGSAAIALAAREPDADPATIGPPAADTPSTLAWTLRGTPHVHRRADLQRIADALWPVSERDAMAMLVGSGKALAANGTPAVEALGAVADAMRATVTGPMPKSALSTALTATLPRRYVARCAPCGVDHVPEMLFRSAALPAGLGLVPGQPATVQPLRDRPIPARAHGRERLVADLMELYGAATRAEIAAHVGVGTAELPWPDRVPVEVDGERLHTTPDLLTRIAATDPGRVTDLVRFLPPGDPLLQPRTRSLIVPDRTHWKTLWPALGPAGAVLAGGGIAGTWRPKTAGRSLTLTIQPFRRFTASEQDALDGEADLVRRIRGLDRVAVRIA